MALDRADARLIAEEIAKANSGSKGGRGASAAPKIDTTGLSDADAKAKLLAAAMAEARESFQNVQRANKDYGVLSKANQLVSKAFGEGTEAAADQMATLTQSIDASKTAYKTAKQEGDKKAASEAAQQMRSSKAQLQNMQALDHISKSADGLATNFFGLQNKLIGIEAAYQTNLMSLVSQGANGFSLYQAAVEANIDRQVASTDAMVSATHTAANALGQMGGVVLPLIGFLLGQMADRAKAVNDAQAALAKQGIKILAEEGDKLIKTHKAMTGAGLIFANGMTGLVDATHGTKLRLEEMTEVVKNNREAFAASGLGMAEATTKVGNIAKIFASTSGTMAKADRQMLALGYSYQDQAAMAAETVAAMSKSGRTVDDKAAAEATKKYAENLSLIASITGEDVKAKMKKIKDDNANMAMEAALAKMTPENAAKFRDAQVNMTGTQQKAMRDMLIFGTVRDKDAAMMMATNAGFRQSIQMASAAQKNGTLDGEKMLDIQAATGKLQRSEALRTGQTTAKAAYAGVQSAEGLAKANFEASQAGQQFSRKTIEAARAAQKSQLDKAKSEKHDKNDPTAAMLDAIEIGAVAAKNMQEKVVGVLGEMVDQLRAHYKSLEDAFNARNFKGEMGGGGADGLMKMAMAAMLALPLLRGMLTGGYNMVMNKIKTNSWSGKGTTPVVETPGGAPGGGAPGGGAPGGNTTAKPALDADRMAKMRELKATGMNNLQIQEEMKRTGGFKELVKSEAKIAEGLGKTAPKLVEGANLASKEMGGIAKATNFAKAGFGKIAGKLPLIGTALTVFSAGMSIVGTEAKLKAGEITKQEAREEEGATVGGAAGGLGGAAAGAAMGAAIGSVIPVLGTAIGGLIGGAIGAWGGAELGAELGKNLMSHWDSITKFFKDLGNMIETMIPGAMAFIKALPDKISEGMKHAGEWVKAQIKAFPAQLKAVFANIGNGLKAAFNSVVDWAKSVDWMGVLGSLADVGISVIKTIFWTIPTSIIGVMADVTEGIATMLMDEVFAPIGGWIWDGIKDMGSWIWDAVSNTAKKLFDMWTAVPIMLFNAIKNSPIGKLGNYIFDVIKNSPIGTFATWIGDLVGRGFATVKDAMSSVVDWMGDKLKMLNPSSWFGGGEKSGDGAAKVTTQTAPAQSAMNQASTTASSASTAKSGTQFNEADKKNIQSWADSVNAGRSTMAQVPEVYRNEVSKMVKNKPATTSATPAAATQTNEAPAVKIAPTATPQKAGLTAAEKAAVNETIATNTKYTNDLLISLQKTMEVTNKAMIQQLAQLTGHAADTSSAAKKTAMNTR